jgi:NAD+ synthase
MNYQNEIDNIAQWMKDYASDAGAEGFIVGLSGGIDSSVIADLAVRAVGKENVIGVSLPCQTRADMKDDAQELAKNLGIRFEKVELRQPVGFLAEGIKMTRTNVDSLVLANIKARLRMTALYAFAGANNYLVAGTGNLSELMVGYFTKYGDGGVDIEPIGMYFKTEVYQMAELMTAIPNNVKTKAPSADLWDGQTDEEELGMPYSELDEILKALLTPNSSELDKFNIDKISKVEKMIKVSMHKKGIPPSFGRSNV